MPQTLYMQFFNIWRLWHAEALDFEYSLKAGSGKLSFDSYKRREIKIEELNNAIDEAVMRIRERCGVEDELSNRISTLKNHATVNPK